MLSKSTKRTVKRTVVSILVFLAVFVLAGCVKKGKTKLTYTGSSTIGENIIPEAFKAFSRQEKDVEIGAIENPGSGKGVEALIQGKAKLAGASRALEPEEASQGLFSQIIGYDAICVFVNKDNPVEALSGEEIKNIFTGKIKNWKEVGGNDAPIVVITEIIGEKRATSLEFQKLAMDGEDYLSSRKEVDRPADEAAELVNEKNGITNASMAFDRPEIKAVAVNNVEPSANNIRAGAYMFSRPLVLATKGQPEGEFKDFIDFMISSEGQAIVNKKFAGSE